MADDLTDQIRAAASRPKSVLNDGVRVEQHNPADLVKADQHLRRVEAERAGKRGFRLSKFQPPGTV